jgi:hypothetical protein
MFPPGVDDVEEVLGFLRGDPVLNMPFVSAVFTHFFSHVDSPLLLGARLLLVPGTPALTPWTELLIPAAYHAAPALPAAQELADFSGETDKGGGHRAREVE